MADLAGGDDARLRGAHLGRAGALGDVNRAAADDRTPAGAGAEFR